MPLELRFEDRARGPFATIIDNVSGETVAIITEISWSDYVTNRFEPVQRTIDIRAKVLDNNLWERAQHRRALPEPPATAELITKKLGSEPLLLPHEKE